MSGVGLLVVVLAASTVAMILAWNVQRRTGNAGIVDVVWSAALGASAVFHALGASGAILPRVLVALMGGLWGTRLALHLWHRVSREQEDGRYAHLRAHWDGDQRKFLAFFLAQAVLIVLFSVPFWIVAHNPQSHWTVWTTLAVVTWLVAAIGETVADRQLAAHRSDPAQRGLTCRSGLWRYSRHPNYFFEWLHWFAYTFLAVGAGAGWVAASLLAPALMLCTLYWITGIPYTEAQALRSRGADYLRYQRTTSALIPWFPRKDSAPAGRDDPGQSP